MSGCHLQFKFFDFQTYFLLFLRANSFLKGSNPTSILNQKMNRSSGFTLALANAAFSLGGQKTQWNLNLRSLCFNTPAPEVQEADNCLFVQAQSMNSNSSANSLGLKLSVWAARAYQHDLLNQFLFSCSPVLVFVCPHPVCTFLQLQLALELHFKRAACSVPSMHLIIVCNCVLCMCFFPFPSAQPLLLFLIQMR